MAWLGEAWRGKARQGYIKIIFLILLLFGKIYISSRCTLFCSYVSSPCGLLAEVISPLNKTAKRDLGESDLNWDREAIVPFHLLDPDPN